MLNIGFANAGSPNQPQAIVPHYKTAALPPAGTEGSLLLLDDGTQDLVIDYGRGNGYQQVFPEVNVRAFGAYGDGVHDDTTAINNALAALPAYSGGVGGGVAYLPPGTYLVPNGITVNKSGVILRGAGPRSSIIKGNVAGAVVGTTAGGNLVDPLYSYLGFEGLFVWNTNTAGGSAVRALELIQCSAVHLRDCSFQAGAGHIIRLHGCVTVRALDCKFGGTTGATTAVYLDGTGSTPAPNNAILFRGCDFSDAGLGLVAVNGSALSVHGCHFEALAGGAFGSYAAALSIDGFAGSSVLGNYWESCGSPTINTPALTYYNASSICHGALVGGNFMTNCGSPFIDCGGLSTGEILPNSLTPGANSANANGAVVSSNNNSAVLLHAQFLASGSGNPDSVTAGTTAGHYTGNQIQLCGTTGTQYLQCYTFSAGVRSADALVAVTDTALKHGPGTAVLDTSLTRLGPGIYGFNGTDAVAVQALTYGTTVATDLSKGGHCTLSVTDGVAFTISNPTNAQAGARLRYKITNNNAGAMGTLSWGNAFHTDGSLSGASTPAAGKTRVVGFFYDGSAWWQEAPATADMT